MATKVGIGLADNSNGHRCGREAARAALAALGMGSPAFALLFTSHSQPADVLRGVNEALGDVALIGTTSAGEYSQQGYVEGGAGVMLIRSQEMRFHPLGGRRPWLSDGPLLGSLQGVTASGLGTSYHHRTLMIYPDDHSMNLDQVVDRAMSETAMLYDILGGPGPTIASPPRSSAIFHDNQMLASGLVGAEFLSERPIGTSLANGWTPIAGPYRVTEVDAHRIITIDGRPARDVYAEFLETQGHLVGAEIPHEESLRYPVGVCRAGECKVSVIAGTDAAGALLVTHADAMIEAAGRALKQALMKLDHSRSSGLLFIDCMSTSMVLGDAYAQQRAVVNEIMGDVPFLGFRSHGVLSRLQGQTAGHFECSVAACLFPK